MKSGSRIFYSIADPLLFSSLFISCCAMLMVQQVNVLFDLNYAHTHYLLFVFTSTITSYNLHWYYTPDILSEMQRSRWTRQYRQLHLLLFFTGLLFSAYFGLKLIHYWPYLTIAVVLTFLYSAPKLPFRIFNILKRIAIGKTLFLAFVWTYVSTLLPFLLSNSEWTSGMAFFGAGRFFFIYAVCIIFDYRDREQDKKEGIRSMITYLGEKGIMMLFYSSLLLSVFFYIGCAYFGFNPLTVITLILPCFLLPFLFSKARTNFSDYLFDFFIDGMLALSPLITLLI